MKKVIITLVGKDMVGIIAKVCTFFANKNINILDISMTTVDKYINMMMIVDVTKYSGNFEKLTKELKTVSEKVGCSINAQQEEIFDMMHRI